MEFTLTLIRGTYTEFEKEGRILGRLDHPANKDGVKMLHSKSRAGEYPAAQAVFSSPLVRCLESARAIYPRAEIIELDHLSAFDYGIFAGKSYNEIVTDKRFKIWANSRMLTAMPGGESPYVFLSRCGQALREIADHAWKNRLENVSAITHQLVIGAMLKWGNMPGCLYCDYHPDYGSGIMTIHREGLGGLSVLKKL